MVRGSVTLNMLQLSQFCIIPFPLGFPEHAKRDSDSVPASVMTAYREASGSIILHITAEGDKNNYVCIRDASRLVCLHMGMCISATLPIFRKLIRLCLLYEPYSLTPAGSMDMFSCPDRFIFVW